MSVSEPKLLERADEDAASHKSHIDAEEDDLDMVDFEQMLVRAQLQVR
jgi:hypothetical protein